MKSIKLIISIFFLFITQFVNIINYIFFRKRKNKFLVLYYHSITEEQIQIFKWQLDKLLSLGEIVHADFNSSLRSNRLFAITFDDGFLSISKNALPILKSLSIPVTIFFPTGYLGKTPGWEVRGENYDSQESVLTEQQILELDKNLVKLGSHSVSHPNFLLLSKEQQLRELTESKEKLSYLIKGNICSFSFPYGAYDKKAINLARESGYKFVFTTLPAFSKVLEDQNFHLRGRVPVNCSDSKIEFMVKIIGGYNWLSGYIKLKKIFKFN